MLRESLQSNTDSITLMYAILQNFYSFGDTMKQVHFDKVNASHFLRIVNILSDLFFVFVYCVVFMFFMYFYVNFLSSAEHLDQDFLVEEILYLSKTFT